VIEAISKAFSNGTSEKITPDHDLTHPCVTETLIDDFTADITTVNELLGRIKTTNAAGFAASAEQVKHKFLDARGIHPLRIIVCRPPLSGKSYVASRLSNRYSLPLITVNSIVAALLLQLLKWKLLEHRCMNQGFVLDGIPSNSDFAEALWQDSASIPQVFIELECSNSFLHERARQDPSMMLGIGNTDEFDGRLLQYRTTNPADDSHLFYFFDPAATRGLPVNVQQQKDRLVPVIAAFIRLVIRHTEAMNRQKRL
jgi:adenylate kinase family enzyme